MTTTKTVDSARGRLDLTLGNGVLNVAQSALVTARVPPHRHGRLFAAVGAVGQIAAGGGTAAAAPLVAGLGAGAMLAAGVTSMLAAVAALLLTANA